ncbi:hypothetical protein FOA52_011552 [Chlamydomonas sp. UWO 241]|nr:hypothetical protein FOA52_011552 [Chlamydomonas sp. UWO 241]
MVLADAVAGNASFEQALQSLRGAFAVMMGDGARGGEGEADPATYMRAVAAQLDGPDLRGVAKELGRRMVMDDPSRDAMLEKMQDPRYRAQAEASLQGMRADPGLAPVLAALAECGPMAMAKFWSDPETITRLRNAVGNPDKLAVTLDADGGAGGRGAGREGRGTGARGGEGERGRRRGARRAGGLEEGRTGRGEGGEGGEEEEEEEEGGTLETLHDAASAGDAGALRALLAAGADADAGDAEGRTPLHYAVGYGELECASVLIDGGAGLNRVDMSANTPLHYASGYGQPRSARLLVERGANCSLLNSDGKTALQVAQLNEAADVVAVLSGEAR